MNLPDFLQPIVAHHAQLSVFVFLLLFGFTLPISEEIALILVGVAVKATGVPFLDALLAAYPALLMADLAYYGIARALGPRVLRSRILGRLVKAESVLDGENYFARRGPRIIFICRFVVGLRASAIVAAGLLRMVLRRFLAYDSLAVAISTPLWMAVGYAFGTQFDSEASLLGKLFAFIGPAAAIAGAILVYRSVKKDSALAKAEAAALSETETSPAEGERSLEA
jgi:membrane protein DedA with SNARE-associated domain